MTMWIARFLASKVSGWLSVLLIAFLLSSSVFVIKQVRDYKELQRAAAFCEGQLSVAKVVKSLQKRAIENLEVTEKETIEEIEDLKEIASEESGEGPMGCAAERAPDAILRYHGWLRDD